MSIDVSPDWWKTMFDEIYLLTDARSVCDAKITRREVDIILELLPVESNHRLLDLCCGHGRHSFELYVRGITDCTLLDYSRTLLDCAKTQAAECNYPLDLICSDARSTGLPDDSFDHVLIMGNSLGYIQLPDADGQILSEAYRVLRPGGWLLVDVTDGEAVKKSFNAGSWHEIGTDTVVCRQRELKRDRIVAREMVLSKASGLMRDQNYALRLYDSQTLPALFRQAGFKSVLVNTDFSPHQHKGDYGFMNHRMLVTGQK